MQIKGVSEAVESRLREEIMIGKMAPGERVNEIGVSERYGVSRPPLREALRRLESENLIISIPRRGSYVTEMSKADCSQIYRTRVMLECGAIDIISEQGGCELGRLEHALEEERKLGRGSASRKKRDPHADYIIMSQFHNDLVEACGNRWVIHYHQQLRPTLGRYQIMYLTVPGESVSAHEEHHEVLELVRSGDYQAAKAAIRTHIERTQGVLERKIAG
ncbi:GntR family transcriptional regulator [Desulfocurvus sp. DL9XJH121]